VVLFNVDVAKGLADIKSRNIIDVEQVRVLNKYLSDAASDGKRPKLFISIDQEGGRVARLGTPHGFDFVMPSAKDMAAKYSALQTEDTYYELGKRLRAIGFNLDFAPVLDVDINPSSPAIGARGRSFSADAARVIEYGRAAAKGLARAGVIYSYKHFPGHGSAAADTHEGISDTTKSFSDDELKPYRELAKTNMPGMIMAAHTFNKNFDSDYPASLSEKTIAGMLRRDIGYDGVVISDDLGMDAISKQYALRRTLKLAILAGNDIILLGNNYREYAEDLHRVAHSTIMDLVRCGEISIQRVRESHRRITKLKNNLE
jgi:beta-N-acetylhexosaminidase